MMRLLAGILAAVAFSSAVPVAAQDDTNAKILAAVDTFLTALNNKDPESMASVSQEIAAVVSLRLLEEGDRLTFRPVSRMMENLAKEEGDLNEVYWDPTVLVSGSIAVAWMPYSFDYNGQRTHCGIDVFNLMRVDGEWTITGVQYTIDAEGCPTDR